MEGIIQPLPIQYQTHSEERFPRVGVFYSNPSGRGICHEFKIDLPATVFDQEAFFYHVYEYSFADEQILLARLGTNNYQAIKTISLHDLNFYIVARVVARIHFESFLRRHPWLLDKTLWDFLEDEDFEY